MYKRNTLAKSIAVAALVGGIASPALAGGDSALLERINLLEQQLRSLKQQVANQGIKQDQVVAAVNRQAGDTKSLKDSIGKIGGFDIKIGGYIKADATWSDASDGDPTNAGFFFPARVPVGGSGESSQLDMTVRESRINFKATRDIAGKPITFFTEMDFYGSGGNEAVSNSYGPRLRHAFFKYDGWLFGQTWSTFQDVSALAENLDFIGPAEGTTFVRQTMVRYTSGGLQLAIENPNTYHDRSLADDSSLPDMIAKYVFKGDFGHVALAGMYRDLNVETGSVDGSDSSLSVSLSGKIKVGTAGSDLRFMLTSGSGIGRYLGVVSNSDSTSDGSGGIDSVDSTGGFISYRQMWNSQWRSNFTYSHLDTDSTFASDVDEATSIHVNLLYSPNKKTTFGVEYMNAERELVSGAEGDIDRVQFSAKYAF